MYLLRIYKIATLNNHLFMLLMYKDNSAERMELLDSELAIQALVAQMVKRFQKSKYNGFKP